MKTGINIMMVMVGLLMFGCGASKSLDDRLVEGASTGQITPEQLVVEDGMVSFDYTISLPARTVARTQVLKMSPVVKYGDQSLELPACFVQGQGVKNSNYPVVKYREPVEMAESYQFPWQEGMENPEVYLLTEVSRCGKLRVTGGTMLYSKGVKLLPAKADGVSEPLIDSGTMTGEIRGIVMFPMAEDRIISGQDYMKSLRDNLDTVMAYPGAVVTSVKILVSCSPDGNAAFNTRLGEERYRIARQYFEKQLGLNRYMGSAGKDMYSYQLIAPNWKSLYNMLEGSDIPARNEMIRGMSGASELKRSQLLVRYMNRYPVIKDQYLPSLRNAQIVITYQMPWYEVNAPASDKE